MERIEYFLGANTASGFSSLYDGLWNPATASAVYLLKGGPGCGKSTLMRQVAARAEAAGLSVEYILCSGDPDSLDAIWLPQCSVAIADATAPHVLEPSCAGVVEHYINLGDCYDRAGLRAARAEILAATEAYRGHYPRAYRCLAAGLAVQAEGRALLETATLRGRMVRRAEGVLKRECKKTGTVGSVTRRFLGGATCQGELCLFGTAEAQCRRIYELTDSYGLGHPFLETLLEGAVAAGYAVIACPSPTDPSRLAHLLIPSLSLGFLSGTRTLPYPGTPYRRIRLDAMADGEILRRNKAKLRFARTISAALFDEATEALRGAKGAHDALEALYHPHVAFGRVDAMAAAVGDEILRGAS